MYSANTFFFGNLITVLVAAALKCELRLLKRPAYDLIFNGERYSFSLHATMILLKYLF